MWPSVSLIDDRLRGTESDLLYAVERRAGATPAWLYVLLQHQPTPDPCWSALCQLNPNFLSNSR